jgi:hypothetical protein
MNLCMRVPNLIYHLEMIVQLEVDHCQHGSVKAN